MATDPHCSPFMSFFFSYSFRRALVAQGGFCPGGGVEGPCHRGGQHVVNGMCVKVVISGDQERSPSSS